jgi:hypothetical protein
MRTLLYLLLSLTFATSLLAQKASCDGTLSYRECRIGSSGNVMLTYEMSTGRCFEGISWGTRSPGVVWVSGGCRAMFEVPKEGALTNVILCESQDGDRKFCRADVKPGVTLLRQLSRADCDEGKSWGYDKAQGFIWVDEGCRAEFEIGHGGARPPVVDLPAIVSCESLDGKRKECAADTSGGVQIAREMSEHPCTFGRDWGWDSKSIWVTRGCRAEFAVKSGPKAAMHAILCESTGKDRALCPADTEFGVALMRRLGDSSCVLDETWGFDEKGVWVSGGCSGQFALGGYRLPQGVLPATATKFVCESADGKPQRCAVDTSRGVGLLKQTSKEPCVLNRSWGYDPEAIWVSSGCRAEFAVAK